MHYYLVVPATGYGKRMASKMPKQYLTLANGKTIIEQTLHILLSVKSIKHTIITVAKGDENLAKLLPNIDPDGTKISTVIGGETRHQSVLNALKSLEKIAQDDDWILVHDAVRPCIKKSDVEHLMKNAAHHDVGALLATPVVDTLKKQQTNRLTTIERQKLWQAQTPQMFRYRLLHQALDKSKHCSDESQAVEQLGFTPKIIMGSRHNIKITHPADLSLANLYLTADNNV